MSRKPLNKSQIRKILLISLTNIGDVILTFPVFDILKRDFPQARLSVIIGPKAESLLSGNSYLDKIYIYDKHQHPAKTIRWMVELWRERFDLVVDLRNTAIPFLIGPRHRTPVHKNRKTYIGMRDKHLDCLKTVYPYQTESKDKFALMICGEDQSFVRSLISKEIQEQGFVMIAPGAADPRKRWTPQGFARVADYLAENYKKGIVLVGDQSDGFVCEEITRRMKFKPVNLAERMTLIQLAALMQIASLVISNDSAPMHLASYLDVPVLALFGPTDAIKYGPWGREGVAVLPDQGADICSIEYLKLIEIIRYKEGKFTFTFASWAQHGRKIL